MDVRVSRFLRKNIRLPDCYHPSWMVAERASTPASRTKLAMARASLGSGSRPLGEEIMEAVGDDLEQSRLPVGLGLGLGSSLEQ